MSEPNEEIAKIPIDVCTQPQCLLRNEEVNSEFLADLLVQLMSGQDVSALVASKRIALRPPCRDCFLAVMHGRKPLLSVGQWKRLVHTGHWSYKRGRRRRTRGTFSSPG